MKNSPPRLHRDLVAIIRRVWTPIVLGKQRRHRLLRPEWLGAVFWASEYGHSVFVDGRSMRRYRRIARILRYDGPITEAA